MVFKLGKTAIRRTIPYLEKDPLYINEKIKILMFSYITKKSPFLASLEKCSGLYDFIYWKIPQIMYQNSQIQFLFFHDKSKTAYIEAFTDKKSIIMDCFDKPKDIIHTKFIENFASQLSKMYSNPAIFGYDYNRHCICEISDAWPCPRLTPIPKMMRGKEIMKSYMEKSAK
ncbi:hypothetical protein A3Q56_00722 [Intoshia linei]|uniref:Uncharacterized protein n=1 Tax=Intoshia linei TaxID=1819745 RepID=A0A177BB19_9BILA|nr:hypothetical protein A3Q56_00722 [Intoshia linei]